MYPSLAFITANPFCIIFFILIIWINLFAKLTKWVVHIIVIAVLTKESISGDFNLRPDFFEYFLGITQFIKTFFSTYCLKLTCIIILPIWVTALFLNPSILSIFLIFLSFFIWSLILIIIFVRWSLIFLVLVFLLSINVFFVPKKLYKKEDKIRLVLLI